MTTSESAPRQVAVAAYKLIPEELLERLVDSLSKAQIFDASTELRQAIAASPDPLAPIDLVVHCPHCGLQHIDTDDSREMSIGGTLESGTVRLGWDNPPHKSHLCRKEAGGCGCIWRPADVPTNGVAVLKTVGKDDRPGTGPKDACVWRCFHCDEVFTTTESAIEHFGRTERQSPACEIDIAEYRAMEQRMLAYTQEDAEIHREMHGRLSDHRLALVREEERGYSRGLADAKKNPEELGLQPIPLPSTSLPAWAHPSFDPVLKFASGEEGASVAKPLVTRDALREAVIAQAQFLASGRGLRELLEAVDAYAASDEDTARLDHLEATHATLFTCAHTERHPRTTLEGGHDTVTVHDGWCVNMNGEEKPTVREAIDASRFPSPEPESVTPEVAAP